MQLHANDANHMSVDAYPINNNIKWSVYSVDLLASIYPPLSYEGLSLVKPVEPVAQLAYAEENLACPARVSYSTDG